jgi:F0F1-type ATP synthase membrane subunit b/b'
VKRPDRSVSFLTMSALDVVATATGVFVLIAVILLPYYLKTFDMTAETEQTKAAAEQLLQQAEAARAEATQDLEKAEEAREEADRLSARLAGLAARTAKLQQDAEAEVDTAEQAKREAEKLETQASKQVIEALDLVFVVDSTASMTNALDELSASMQGLTRILERLVPSLRIGIVAYRDYDVGPWATRKIGLTPTGTGLDRILDFARSLGPPRSGGTSVTEAVYAGLQEAVALPFRPGAKQVLIVMGDAAAHPAEQGATLSLIRRFVTGAPDRSLSVLFVATAAYYRWGRGDKEFFEEMARAGDGSFHERAGSMTEVVLQSVLAD